MLRVPGVREGLVLSPSTMSATRASLKLVLILVCYVFRRRPPNLLRQKRHADELGFFDIPTDIFHFSLSRRLESLAPVWVGLQSALILDSGY